MITNENKLLSLYIHWPYCESKCPYCDFNSHVNEICDPKQWIKSYTNQLLDMNEQLLSHNVSFNNLNAIFFGGGTPSLMPLEIIDSILRTASNLFGFEENIEISLEANPSSYEKEKFNDLEELGINRISIGVQSLNDENLKFLGRRHSSLDAQLAVEHAVKTFNNVSVDLIYAFYGQKLLHWTNELEIFLKHNDLQHLSLYQLTIEKGTRFYTDYKKGLLNIIDNDYPGKGDLEDLLSGVDYLTDKGFVNESRMYVQGCSGGGVLTAWVVGHDDRFAAAASLCPVTNWISMVGTTDIPAWTFEWFEEPFWDDPSEWLEHSPIMRTGYVKTPTLFMTGVLDIRTPMAQSEEMYIAFKHAGIETALIRMNEEWHGTDREKPTNWFRSYGYLSDWYEKYPSK